MNTTGKETTAISSTPRRVILASAYRHERHATHRQQRALKAIRKMGRFDDNATLEQRPRRRVWSTEETLDD